MPTLLSWNKACLSATSKASCTNSQPARRHEHAHNRILRFEPAAASGSCCFNPMEELRIGTEHEVGDVQNLALLIVDPDVKGLRADSHWQKTAYSLSGRLHPAPVLQGQSRGNASNLCRA